MTGMKSDRFGGWGRVAVLAALMAAALLVSMACFQDTSRSLVLTTTTSTYDSGLLDYIIPPFEEEYNANVRVISVERGRRWPSGHGGTPTWCWCTRHHWRRSSWRMGTE